MFDSRLPREFKNNYLTQQIAMKVAGILSGDLFTNVAESRTRKALAQIIEKNTNRSFTDCENYVEKISTITMAEFTKKARKFVR